jgi:hypothetical protein
MTMPGQVDSNSPAYWKDGRFHLLNSTGNGPVRSTGSDQFHLGAPETARINYRINPWPLWVESVRVEDNGVMLGWYHQEHFGVCPGTNFSVPHIGQVISYDGGNSYYDMGEIISSGDSIDCRSQNGYFAGGTGDFSVVLDRDKKFLYFFFSNYAGPVESQGVAIARMPYASRFAPIGAVRKYYQGTWTEPGVHGRVTPVFPAKVSWQQSATDSFWGPSLHWNTYLKSYVMLLNRSCCTSGFPQKGIYASYSADLGDPASWSKPVKILKDTGWYPQILGLGKRGTDQVAGRKARFYTQGHSRWKIVFTKPTPAPDPPTPAAQ